MKVLDAYENALDNVKDWSEKEDGAMTAYYEAKIRYDKTRYVNWYIIFGILLLIILAGFVVIIKNFIEVFA